jgi:two-component system KDP operon response regulator KdpE
MPAHILVVDDDEAMAAFLGDRLSKLGYEVSVAHTGREALERMRARPPELLLVDLVMPDMGGWELVRTVRADSAFRHLPILVCTAVKEARPSDALVQGILHKPFQLDEIERRIRNALAPIT